MSLIVRLGRSLLRIVVVTAIVIGLGVAVLAIALRQPTLTSLAFKGNRRADPERLRHHVTFLTDNVRPRDASHPENLDRAARYIADHFRAANGATSVQTFTARGSEYSNVIARWGSNDPKQPVLIIGAHYDAFSANNDLPGADDNASGTAGLLELARLLGEHPVTSPVLLVAYTTEEPPFFGSDEMGSAVHAKSVSTTGRPVRGMIALEMIGYFSNDQSWPNPLFELLYPSTGDFIGVVGGWPDRALARFVKRSIAGSGGVPVVSFSGPRATSDASDHRNYWSHGWKAIVITDTAFLRNPNYHTRLDTADTLDYPRMARVVDGVLNAALHASDF